MSDGTDVEVHPRWLTPGAVVFLGALAVLVGAMAPGLYLRDSGELTTAAYTLGVAHETGFPLYCLLGKAAAFVPLGEVATRLNFLSALSAATAAWLVYRLVRTLASPPVSPTASLSGNAVSPTVSLSGKAVSATASLSGNAVSPTVSLSGNAVSPTVSLSGKAVSPTVSLSGNAVSPTASLSGKAVSPTAIAAGAAAAVLFVAGYTVWKQATVAEVYAPTAALMALLLLLSAQLDAASAQGPSHRHGGERAIGLALWLVAGLGLGLHASIRLVLLPLLAVHALVRLRRGQRWPLLAPLAYTVGAAVVCYLPVAASRAPIANWGDPRTLGAMLAHLAATRIRRAFADEILARDPVRLIHNLGRFLGLVEGQLGLPAILLAAVGLLWLLRRRRAMGLLLCALLAGDVLYAAWINPMGIDDLQCGVPTALALAVSVGVGIAALADFVRAPAATVDPLDARGSTIGGMASLAFAAALGVIACVPAIWSDAEARFAVGQEAPSWVAAALREAPSRSLLLTESDDLSAGIEYAQGVWGARPDVTALVRQHLWDATYVARTLERRDAGVLPVDELASWRARPERARIRDERHLLETLVAHNLGRRALLWEPGDDQPPSGFVVPGVPLQTLVAALAPAPAAHPLVEKIAALLGEPQDPLARRLEAGALTALGAAYFRLGDETRAASLFDTALKVRRDDSAAAVNLAIVKARRGEVVAALHLVESVLARDPDRPAALIVAGQLRLDTGDLDGAEADFRRVLSRSPGSARPLVGLARVAQARGDRAAARAFLDQALRFAPDDAEALAVAAALGPR